MKTILTLVFALSAALSMAQSGCCGAQAKAASCDSKQAKAACDGKTAKQGCEGKTMCAEEEFMAEAHRMMASAEGKQSCCKSTAAKPMAKGDKGCCNAKGEAAKFKVFVAGEGYKYFGCEGSAAKGRKELVAKGAKVGQVQKVSTKVAMN